MAVVQAELNRHPILASLDPRTPTWARLQFVESEVIVGSLLSLIRLHSIPALPIHDSILVRQEDAVLAKETLSRVFRSHTGIVPVYQAAEIVDPRRGLRNMIHPWQDICGDDDARDG